ncbi:TrkH family potassium uptake protein [Oricola cellulosilytica]|uniref:Trk system potassium uptake protein n=1 Tax=Oricola cellulosilytica TaxID=1429082 RepID=A0A4R0P5W6_9HYPH|nr:TrkH family potassium uptake protein [Oricola cellulosilytica]TCD12315.1 TrkH family potassium uptake protein [Oricola cellulosilytica]
MKGRNLHAAIHVSAVFAIWLAALMLIPALTDLYYGNPDWLVFAISALLVAVLGILTAVATRDFRPTYSVRFAFLLVNILWLTFAVAGALPFIESSQKMTVADAFFESMSGITTTGSTVMTGLDGLPPGLLLWRSILQWVGGLGVIVLGLFILPYLKIGGSSVFKLESSDRYTRPFSRLSTFATSLLGIYVASTLVCAVLYAMTGMSIFDSINHAMTTVSTGGFSTHDTSFEYFTNPLTHWVAIVFMLIGGIPFTALIVLMLRGRFDTFRDNQVLVMLAYAGALSLAVAVYLELSKTEDIVPAITHSTFNIVSLVTTTGYASANYLQWGSFAIAIAFMATFLGGCSGSTAGGIKAYRWIALYGVLRRAIDRFIYPHAVASVHSGKDKVSEETLDTVLLFFAAYMLLWALLTVALTLTGIDFLTAISGALTALSNVGPGLGDVIGPTGNFDSLPDSAKWILSFAMLVGRLEIFTVLVLLSPTFWQE